MKLFFGLFLFSCSVHASAFNPDCIPDKQKLRSQELQVLVAADQSDRQLPPEKIDWNIVGPRDEARRKRIGEIYGEGCMTSAADYAAAALVYQHGIVPDHYFQTFLWAKRAVELGDVAQKDLMAKGIDRYLVHSGKKQLFGTQASKATLDASSCWCVDQIEPTFPDSMRPQYKQKTLKEVFAWVKELNASYPQCKVTAYCAASLIPTPAGSVPGFW